MKKIILAATVTFMCFSSFAQTDSMNNQMNSNRFLLESYGFLTLVLVYFNFLLV